MLVDFEAISHDLSRNQYPLIGSGSGRNVYDLGNGYVVKKARNYKGIAQNKAEYQIFDHGHSDLFAGIEALSEDYALLIMEKAEPVRSMSDVWRYYHVRSPREFFNTNLFRSAASKYGLLPNDLYRKTSWGYIHEKPVVIDYGFTRDTRKYYRFF